MAEGDGKWVRETSLQKTKEHSWRTNSDRPNRTPFQKYSGAKTIAKLNNFEGKNESNANTFKLGGRSFEKCFDSGFVGASNASSGNRRSASASKSFQAENSCFITREPRGPGNKGFMFLKKNELGQLERISQDNNDSTMNNYVEEGNELYNLRRGTGKSFKQSFCGEELDRTALEETQLKDPKNSRSVGFHKLKEVSEQSPEKILALVANSHTGFMTLLKEQKNMSPHVIFLVLKILSKVNEMQFQEIKTTVIIEACQKNFLDQLQHCISNLPLEEKRNMKPNLNDFFKHLFVFYKCVMDALPATVFSNFKNLFLRTDMCIKGLADYQDFELQDHLKNVFNRLNEQLKQMIKDQNEKINKREKNYPLPPDNFRDINIFPTSEEILSKKSSFIRPNIVKGSYESVDHYLDVQFRLLREDFIGPLRESVSEFLEMKDLKNKCVTKTSSMRFYTKVTFLYPLVLKGCVGIKVMFDPDQRVNGKASLRDRLEKWKTSKHFMYGSLLIFSRDNFENIIVATVAEREVKDLCGGMISVQLQSTQLEGLSSNFFKHTYVMGESEIFFESYHHVLKGLQWFTEETFPMKDYIVHARNLEETIHSRSEQSDVDRLYSLLEKTLSKDKVEAVRRLMSVTAGEECGMRQSLELDDSQNKALMAAESREFVVIQGPPGTGKTFLGLQIVNDILNGKNNFTLNQSPPILVICFTNHALDQFLEGIISTSTKKVVRVGGQSKSDILPQYNLNTLRRYYTYVWKKRRQERINYYKLQYGDDMLFDDEFEDYYWMNDVDFRFNDYRADLEQRLKYLMRRIQVIQSTIRVAQQNIGVVYVGSRSLAEWLLDVDGCEVYLEYDDIEFGSDDVTVKQPLADELYEVNSCILESEGAENAREEFDTGLEFTQKHVEVSVNDVYEVTVQHLEEEVEVYRNILDTFHSSDEEELLQLWYWEELYQYSILKKNCLKYYLSHRPSADLEDIERLKTQKKWEMSLDDRWKWYSHKLSQWEADCRQQQFDLEQEFRNICSQYEELRNMTDLRLLARQDVVGMTTTGASRLQSLLRVLAPTTVIVEEAAEVLESHIVVALSQACKRLILIGDHKQLRPTTAVYKLAREFHFDVSLFERMVNSGIHCETLGVQHRMRPEIARLLVPTIYPTLENHSSVYEYPHIRGVGKSLFFIDHNVPENQTGETTSHRNEHEADFLLALCKYLVLQGYDPSEITILVTYTAQMLYLRSRRNDMDLLKNVRMTVVDNFQGEENKIILLSLVRSNEEANIGFLKIQNRVCVALSRAREGLYIIGNMGNLTQASDLWREIKKSLIEQNAFGTELTLQCEVHPAVVTQVSLAEHFTDVREGGCNELCRAALKCGHLCKRLCHPVDQDHANSRCYEPCERVSCEHGHRCQDFCWVECGPCKWPVSKVLPCGHQQTVECHVDGSEYRCKVKIQKQLECGHGTEMFCGDDVRKLKCKLPCENRLQCGHKCPKKCHFQNDPDHLQFECKEKCARNNAGCSRGHKCAKQCWEQCEACPWLLEEQTLECGHEYNLRCSQDPTSVVCIRRCARTLQCGHDCNLLCWQPCGQCSTPVDKTIPRCGHQVSVACSEEPTSEACKEKCSRTLICGHPCTEACRDPCTTRCTVLVDSSNVAACGHAVSIPCYIKTSGVVPVPEELVQYCSTPCTVALECGHPCSGSCVTCFQGRIHAACTQKCGKTLVCGHSCDVSCASTCPPCNKQCEYRCVHSRCSRKCGQPCIPCKMECTWKCEHYNCRRKCHELCLRPPCYQPCCKPLACGHPCIGFCGEPCPPLCRVCNHDQVCTVFLGFEDEPDARFVYLEDCQHTVESRGLEMWLQQDSGQITTKVCPLCKTAIARTQRYMNLVKNLYADIAKVKRKVFGSMKEIDDKRNTLLSQVNNITQFYGSTQLQTLHKCVLSSLQKVVKQRVNVLSAYDLQTVSIHAQIVKQVCDDLRAVDRLLTPSIKSKLTERVDVLLGVLVGRGKHLCQQEVREVNRELQRLHRASRLAVVESTPGLDGVLQELQLREVYGEVTELLGGTGSYNEEADLHLKKLLEQLMVACKKKRRLMDEERQQIVKAMGLKQGHWFKCPSGHVYVITECGGAMEVGKCNECGADIGGTQHTLLQTNTLASEMDGARHPAWSNTANLANYDLQF